MRGFDSLPEKKKDSEALWNGVVPHGWKPSRFGGFVEALSRLSLFELNVVSLVARIVAVVPDTTTPGQSDPLDPLSSLMTGGSTSQRYQDYVSPRSLSTDSSTTESPVHEEQGFGQNYGNYFPTPGVLPSILYSQLYGNQFQNSESAEQRAVADSCSVRQEEVRPDNNVWRPY